MLFQDILFPVSCLVYNKLGSYICLSCQTRLNKNIQNICFYCKKPSLYGFTHPLCKRIYGIDGTIFIYQYNNEIKRIIKNIKYRLVEKGLNELLKLSSNKIYLELTPLLNLYKNLELIPIPLFITRQKIRGFNQAEIISIFLSKYFNLPLEQHLIRKKNTKSQAMLKTHKKRYLNMKGAFEVSDPKKIKNRNFLLIDDVVTSGSTMREACCKLKRKKAQKVFIFALAKG